MPQTDEHRSAGQSFAGNVMKYSVATYLGFVITGAALIVKGLLPSEVLGAPVTFMTYTATFMNIGILGLDQALLRFYHEPPAGAAPRQLFAVCTRLSTVFMLALGVLCSVAAAGPLAAALGLTEVTPFGPQGEAIGRLGVLPAAMTLSEFAARVRQVTGAPGVLAGDAGLPVRRVAVLGGSGSDELPAARAAGADTYLTGELAYHHLSEAPERGMNLLAAGHFYTENPVCQTLRQMLL